MRSANPGYSKVQQRDIATSPSNTSDSQSGVGREFNGDGDRLVDTAGGLQWNGPFDSGNCNCVESHGKVQERRWRGFCC